MDKEDMGMTTAARVSNRLSELLGLAIKYAPSDEKEAELYYEKLLREFVALTPLQQNAILAYLRAEQVMEMPLYREA